MEYLLDTNICIHFFRGKFDLIIGCTSVEKELTLVTENVHEFERISNIRIENWIDRTKKR
jgi:tRNA(fMet)-specific endonuclease VapC